MSKFYGRRVSAEELAQLAASALRSGPFRPSGVTLHHTGEPELADRPHGFSSQHIKWLWEFYTERKKWSAGPHVFVDDQPGFVVLTKLNERGVHAEGFNHSRWGIEVLGWYDHRKDDPHAGRGLECWRKGAEAARILAGALGDESPKVGKGRRINFHRHSGKTTKTCPGNRISEAFVQELLQSSRPAGWALIDKQGNPWLGPVKESKKRVLVRRFDVASMFGAWGRLGEWPVLETDSESAGWIHVRSALNILRVDSPSKTIVFDGLRLP
jgi:hypothetical protein